jgi:hypothetical protein
MLHQECVDVALYNGAFEEAAIQAHDVVGANLRCASKTGASTRHEIRSLVRTDAS